MNIARVSFVALLISSHIAVSASSSKVEKVTFLECMTGGSGTVYTRSGTLLSKTEFDPNTQNLMITSDDQSNAKFAIYVEKMANYSTVPYACPDPNRDENVKSEGTFSLRKCVADNAIFEVESIYNKNGTEFYTKIIINRHTGTYNGIDKITSESSIINLEHTGSCKLGVDLRKNKKF